MLEKVGRRLVPILDSCGVLGGIGRTKLYELINSGQLTRVRIGSRAFITGESLENFLNQLADGAASRGRKVVLDGEWNDEPPSAPAESRPAKSGALGARPTEASSMSFESCRNGSDSPSPDSPDRFWGSL